MFVLNMLSDKPVIPAAKKVEKTENQKIDKISDTMMSPATCPARCPLFDKIRYEDFGFLQQSLGKIRLTVK